MLAGWGGFGNRCPRNVRGRGSVGGAACGAILPRIDHKMYPPSIYRKIGSWSSQDSSVGTGFGEVQAAALDVLEFQAGSGGCRGEGCSSTNDSNSSCHD